MSSQQSVTLERSFAGSADAAEAASPQPVEPSEAAPEVQQQPEQAVGDVSAVAWEPRDEMDRSQWLDEGRKLGAVGRGSQWWIGDWVRYGAKKWGEKYVEAARLTGYDEASLRNMSWVASQFSDLSLRSDKLSWSHHVLLAPLDDDEKREWLTRAAEEKLSVTALREILHPKSDKKELEPADPTEAEPIEAESDATATATCPNCGHKIPLATAADPSDA